ncbi:MAG: type II secretion system protein [bacterium]|nr:type II secretion system protein [bacterium]
MITRRQKTSKNRGFTHTNSKRSLGGFTIIEILIVLAIAGLILTMVFIAVPQLQRNTRDNQRQNIASRLSSELNAFSSNNQGAFPFSGVPGATAGTLCNNQAVTAQNCGDWFSRYINGNVNIKDPKTGSPVNIYYTASVGPFTWTAGSVFISVGNKCNGEVAQSGGGGGANSKQYALLITLERTGTWYCIDNG